MRGLACTATRRSSTRTPRGVGEPREVLADREIEAQAGVGSGVHELVEVVRRTEVGERAARRRREDRHRARPARGGQSRAVDRVDHEVECAAGFAVTGAEPLARMQHGRVVLLALA